MNTRIDVCVGRRGKDEMSGSMKKTDGDRSFQGRFGSRHEEVFYDAGDGIHAAEIPSLVGIVKVE